MQLPRFGVMTTLLVDAADADEAALMVERDFAGRFDAELVSVTAHLPATVGVVARRACRSASSITKTSWPVAISRGVRDDGVLVFDGFTDSFDDDGMRPRPWCGACSQEWDLPEGEVAFE